ncbi:MAG: hypothetical protein ACL93V_02900 [Candidatus Electrothrix sp. YB6]
MTPARDYFVFFRESIWHLNTAWRILKEIKTGAGTPILVNAAFQFALIEYCKPYKHSYGNIKNAKGKLNQHQLDQNCIPPEYLSLHQRIIDARDQIHAHGDLTVLYAKVYVEESPYGKIAGYVRNVVHGTEELENIDSIIDLIEQTLDSMYEEEEKLKQKLPID